MVKNYAAVSAELRQAEALFESKQILALRQMVDLYAQASQALNHEVADAIELWIYENPRLDIVDYIKTKIGQSNAVNHVYLKWIDGLHARL